MKYTVHYNVRRTVEFHIDGTSPEHVKQQALWWARNDAGRPDVEITQILPEGVPSALLNDQPSGPRGPTRPLPPPPMPPLGSAGDMMLARVA